MGKPPAFQFYAADFVLDTASMTAEQVGAYMRLLCFAWVNGGAPADEAQQAQIAGMPRRRFATVVWPALERCWKSDGNGHLINPRMEAVRKDQDAYREAKSAAGKAGAEARWN